MKVYPSQNVGILFYGLFRGDWFTYESSWYFLHELSYNQLGKYRMPRKYQHPGQ